MQFVIILLAILFGQIGSGRPLQTDDEDYSTLLRVHYQINEDGSYTKNCDVLLFAKTKAGKEALTSYVVSYDSSTSNIDASNINGYVYNFPNNTRVPTIKSFGRLDWGEGEQPLVTEVSDEALKRLTIPDPESKTKEWNFSFPRIELTSVVHISYSLMSFKPDFPGYVDFALNLTNTQFEKGCQYIFDSTIPLNIEPPAEETSALSYTHEVDTKALTNRILIQVDETFVHGIVGEMTPKRGAISQLNNSNFRIHSADRYQEKVIDFAQKIYSKLYDVSIRQTLETSEAQRFQTEYLAEIAAAMQDEIRIPEDNARDQLFKTANRLIIFLNKKIMFHSILDNFSTRNVPMAFPEIMERARGNCKDYSYLLMLALRDLGYDAQLAWVRRSLSKEIDKNFYTRPYDITNHVVVCVNFEGSKIWLDPTNDGIVFDYTPYDIQGSPAYIFPPEEGANSVATQIPLKFRAGTKRVDVTLEKIDNTLRRQDQITDVGIKSLNKLYSLHGREKSYYEQQINHSIRSLGARTDLPYGPDLSNIDTLLNNPLHSRDKRYKSGYSYHIDISKVLSKHLNSSSFALAPTLAVIPAYLSHNSHEEFSTAFEVMKPTKNVSKTTYLGFKEKTLAIGEQHSIVEDNDYFKLKRTLVQSIEGLSIKDTFTPKKSHYDLEFIHGYLDAFLNRIETEFNFTLSIEPLNILEAETSTFHSAKKHLQTSVTNLDHSIDALFSK